MDDFYTLFPLGQKTLQRSIEYQPNGIYHVFNRRQDSATVFRDDDDRGTYVDTMKRLLDPSTFRDERGRTLESFAGRVRLLGYCILDNHFHQVLRALDDATAITDYMHRLMGSYGRKFNNRHNRSGPLFDQPFQPVPVESSWHLKNLVAYVHANPDQADTYRWSGHRRILERSTEMTGAWYDPFDVIDIYGSEASYRRYYAQAVARRRARIEAKRHLRRPW